MQIFLSSYTHKTTFHMVLKNILPLIHPPLKNSIEIRLNNNSTYACHSFPFLKSQDIKKSFPQKRGNDLHMFLKKSYLFNSTTTALHKSAFRESIPPLPTITNWSLFTPHSFTKKSATALALSSLNF